VRSSPTTSRDHPLILKAKTAGELMSPNPVSIQCMATVPEATALLTDRGFSAAPVIDEAGRAVGVISRTDLLVHDRERMTHVAPAHEEEDPLARRALWQNPLPEGFTVEEVDPTMVCDIMTPVVFSVMPDTPVEQVVEDMLGLRVHQLFVVDRNQVLVGVISGLDVLRHLQPMELAEI
jgi:CBS-domain-containing membrane protein